MADNNEKKFSQELLNELAAAGVDIQAFAKDYGVDLEQSGYEANTLEMPEGIDLSSEEFKKTLGDKLNYLSGSVFDNPDAMIHHIPGDAQNQYLAGVETFKNDHSKGSLVYSDAELEGWSDAQINALLEREATLMIETPEWNISKTNGMSMVDAAWKTGAIPEGPTEAIKTQKVQGTEAQKENQKPETEEQADTSAQTGTEDKKYGLLHNLFQGMINRAAKLGINIPGIAAKFGFDLSKYGYEIGKETQADNNGAENEGNTGSEDEQSSAQTGGLDLESDKFKQDVVSKLNYMYGASGLPGSNIDKIPSAEAAKYKANVEEYKKTHTQSLVYSDEELKAFDEQTINAIRAKELDIMNEWTDGILVQTQETAATHIDALSLKDENNAKVIMGRSSYLAQMMTASSYVMPAISQEVQNRYIEEGQKMFEEDTKHIEQSKSAMKGDPRYAAPETPSAMQGDPRYSVDPQTAKRMQEADANGLNAIGQGASAGAAYGMDLGE